ncbi:signal recognition particle-docking protein FtsY [Methanobacterium spitsbergense]|uniref:Signal recognition particle receptor FtsY n=1 Tax=Methanobacterium spitsbergense TaxID=2874285 RepID=A0A8T5V293_9EURY|nr:signal recognition particle-docking protein FtsY [Methanobacterium spitsbergense]MBZ2165981.1 signal recognition particle-docking protein FtsY [Methanobacterium spitsbergense]
MFESLKKKFTGTIGKISDKVTAEEELEAASEETEVVKSTEKSESPKSVEKPDTKPVDDRSSETESKVEDGKKSGMLGFLRGKPNETDEIKDEKSIVKESSELETPISDETELIESETSEKSDDKSGIFSFVRNKTISEKDIDDILFELELALLEGDVAMDVAEKIINSVKDDLIGRKIRRRSDVTDFTRDALKKAISNILDIESKDVISLAENAKKSGEPLKIMFVGINGTGKTTTIAKISTYFLEKGYTPVIAASDTFRAGAIEQLTHHADKLGVKIIKHKKGADPAAVAFDAVEHAKAKGKELVLVDTAGRMQTNINLMDEMKKIKRVIHPDLIIYVGDALTGNDSVEQAQKFNEAVGIDGIILTKADADAKGGAALSIGYVIQKPILFLGVGQSYSDIIEFKPEWMVEQIIG